MPHRRRLSPDTRLDWRDPNMPLVRDFVVLDSNGRIAERGVELVAPEEIQEIHRDNLKTSDEPDWRKDPTYRLRKGDNRTVEQALIDSIEWEPEEEE